MDRVLTDDMLAAVISSMMCLVMNGLPENARALRDKFGLHREYNMAVEERAFGWGGR